MNKGALALLIHGGSDNWSPQRWQARFGDVCGDRRVALMPDATLDPAEEWTWDAAATLWKTSPQETIKTKKVKKAIVLYPATPEHPAQTQLIDEDVVVGTWMQVKQSGAIKDDVRRALVRRCEVLQRAVKQARERANMAECRSNGRPGDFVNASPVGKKPRGAAGKMWTWIITLLSLLAVGGIGYFVYTVMVLPPSPT